MKARMKHGLLKRQYAPVKELKRQYAPVKELKWQYANVEERKRQCGPVKEAVRAPPKCLRIHLFKAAMNKYF